MKSDTFDAVIVGAGIVGAASAVALIRRKPTWRIAVVEKEDAAARHQTGRNSGVIHSGVYYTPGSLKAKLCREGLDRTYAFARQHNVRAEKRGKLLVATNSDELARLEDLEARAGENGVVVERLDQAALKALEPAVTGLGALRVPVTGIVDYPGITRALLGQFENAGGTTLFSAPVTRLERNGDDFAIAAGARTLTAGHVIGCAGLASDRLARMAGLATGVHIVPFRGEYFTLPSSRGSFVHHLIYPVPDPKLPFLGVHLTPMINGTVTVGPNAVLALSRESYGKFSIDLKDSVTALAYPGTWRAVLKHASATGNELASWLSRRKYLTQVRKYCPELHLADLQGYWAGNRAQAIRPDGSLVDDFLIVRSEGMTMVLNAPSPAATSALPIGEHIVNEVLGDRICTK